MEKPETLKTVNRLFSFHFVPKCLWTPPAACDTFGCGMLGAWLHEPGLCSLHSLHQITQGWLLEASAFVCHLQLVTVIPQGATPLKENTRT